MALKQIARAKSLAWTGTGPTSPLANIQNWSFSRNKELAEFTSGTSRVNSHYLGKTTASITVDTADMSKFTGFVVGQKFTAVTLVVEGAVDSSGTANESDATIVLSSAVVTEVGEIESDNEDSAPVVGRVTFTLSRFATAGADPTWTIT